MIEARPRLGIDGGKDGIRFCAGGLCVDYTAAHIATVGIIETHMMAADRLREALRQRKQLAAATTE